MRIEEMTPAFRRREPALAVAVLAVAGLTLATILPMTFWRGDWSWGPRYLFGVPEAAERDRAQELRPLASPGKLLTMLLSHVDLRVRDRVKAAEFYDAFLNLLGAVMEIGLATEILSPGIDHHVVAGID